MDAAKKFGQKAIYLKTDVSKKSDMEACFNETLKKFGTIDIVINNAGILDEERYELLIDTNIKGVIYGTLLGFKHMGKHRKGKGGIVVNVASIVGVRQFAGFPVYTGTKHFVIGFSRAIGSPFYYDNTGVKILSILPGFTETVLIHKVPTLKEFEELKLNEYTNNKIATFAAQP
ncbi:PREDICTED: alcohol dehydrogenase-like [Nicrophorus vespilloides]|uniref:Alcohol dehydrogenase-like n=1 Tax=Nicrophorus vespilloides TaxID=110193 RepID=A0ABM1M4F3_NICVS|nr:PREDICTED: alcohol dehydrogenase-like [Nicrophorus vespilloides]